MNTQQIFRYYLSHRSPGYAHNPPGFSNMMSQLYQDTPLPEQYHSLILGNSLLSHGWVEYDHPLSYEQIYQFELIPADPVERVLYQASHDELWKQAAVYDNLLDWLNAPLETVISEWQGGWSSYAIVALVLIEFESPLVDTIVKIQSACHQKNIELKRLLTNVQ